MIELMKPHKHIQNTYAMGLLEDEEPTAREVSTALYNSLFSAKETWTMLNLI